LPGTCNRSFPLRLTILSEIHWQKTFLSIVIFFFPTYPPRIARIAQ
jgi:hypothetical protein